MRVILLESLHPDAEAILESAATVVRADSPDEDTAVALAPNADAIITRGRGQLTEAALNAATRLKCVARAGAGLDNIAARAAVERGVVVVYAPDAATETTAEHAVALTLAAARRIPAWSHSVKAGGWATRSTAPPALDLSGRTLGVVGFGRIGTRVAEMASAFGMRVIYATRTSTDDRFERVSLEELLRRAEVVSIHVDLNDSTIGLLDAEAFAAMREGVLLVNCARGPVVDEDALIVALKSGKLRGYAADVMSGEPPPADHPLFAFENVTLTPHSAALVKGAYRRMCVETAENTLRVLRGEEPNPANLWRGNG